jgi:RNA polymerase sigma factor (sigma-70 family)
MSDVIQHLRRTIVLQDEAGLTDGQLLADYVSRRDAAALATLVRRHGPMVWGVCQRVLRNQHDAEDAFQATFLVLVRKAASIASPKLVANWLYGVAHQTALKARATAAKRKVREKQVTAMPEPAATEPDLGRDLLPMLDQELNRLPDKYRIAIVLCDLEGKTRTEAARQLGVPEGTLAARVARGRRLLAKRLARHGLAVTGGALGILLTQNAASAGVPPSVVSTTIKAASLFAAGQATAPGVISAKAAVLTEGVLKTMLLAKLKVVTVLCAMVAALGWGSGWLAYHAAAAGPPRTLTAKPAKVGASAPEQKPLPDQQRSDEDKASDRLIEAVFDRIINQPQGIATAKLSFFIELATWHLTAVDAAKKTVSLRWTEGLVLNELTVAADAQVFIDGQQKQFADLKPGMWLTPKLSPGDGQIARIFATSKEADLYVVWSVNVEQSVLKLRLGGFAVDFPVTKDARITIRNQQVKLGDLQKGMPIAIELGVADNRLAVKAIRVLQ